MITSNTILTPENKRLRGLNSTKNQRFNLHLENYQRVINDFERKYHINYQAIETMNFIYVAYCKTGMPLSVNKIQRAINKSCWVSVKEQISRLIDKGLVQVAYQGYSKHKMYEPTPRVLKDYELLAMSENIKLLSKTA